MKTDWPKCSSSGCEDTSIIEIISRLGRKTDIFGSISRMKDDTRYIWADYFCKDCFNRIEKDPTWYKALR